MLPCSARAMARLLRSELRTSARFQNSFSRLRLRQRVIPQRRIMQRMATAKMPPMTAGTTNLMPCLPSLSRHDSSPTRHLPSPRTASATRPLARWLNGAMESVEW